MNFKNLNALKPTEESVLSTRLLDFLEYNNDSEKFYRETQLVNVFNIAKHFTDRLGIQTDRNVSAPTFRLIDTAFNAPNVHKI